MTLAALSGSTATTSAVSDSSGGDVAFRVLSNPQLFRLLPQWTTGWPFRVTQRWREIAAVVEARQALPTWYRLSSERQVELFMRELLFTGDVDTLRLTGDCTWRGRDGTLEPFTVTEPQFAVRSGRAETVRWALEQYTTTPGTNRTSLAGRKTWLWQEAMIYLPDHCDVLYVLQDLLPVTRQFWLNKDDCIRSVLAVQWITDTFGVEALSSTIMAKAALHGNLPLVEFMDTIPGQNVQHVMTRLDEYPSDVRAFLQKHRHVLKPSLTQTIIQRVASVFVATTANHGADRAVP